MSWSAHSRLRSVEDDAGRSARLSRKTVAILRALGETSTIVAENLLIFDAQYSLADQISVKGDWGHSSNMIAVELAQLAGVKHLAMYHHEPVYDDRMIETVLGETRRYAEISRSGQKLTITSAYDGLEIVL